MYAFLRNKSLPTDLGRYGQWFFENDKINLELPYSKKLEEVLKQQNDIEWNFYVGGAYYESILVKYKPDITTIWLSWEWAEGRSGAVWEDIRVNGVPFISILKGKKYALVENPDIVFNTEKWLLYNRNNCMCAAQEYTKYIPHHPDGSVKFNLIKV